MQSDIGDDYLKNRDSIGEEVEKTPTPREAISADIESFLVSYYVLLEEDHLNSDARRAYCQLCFKMFSRAIAILKENNKSKRRIEMLEELLDIEVFDSQELTFVNRPATILEWLKKGYQLPAWLIREVEETLEAEIYELNGVLEEFSILWRRAIEHQIV